MIYMKNRKIVFLLPSLKNGGGNRVVIELSNQIVLQGYEVFIIYPNNSKDRCNYFINDSIKLIPVGELSYKKFPKLVNLTKVLDYVNYNFLDESPVIFTDPIMSLFSPIVRSRNKYRFIQADDYKIFDDLHILRNRLLLVVYKILTVFSYRYYDTKIIFNSRYTFDRFVSVAKKKCPYRLVHPAINHAIFSLNRVGKKTTKPTIGIVARKHPWKGFVDFISALKQIDENLYSEVIVISHDDLTAFDLSGMMIFHPESDREIACLYNRIDVFVSTSWWEGFGLPPLEAMACGCAVIASKSGGVNEYACHDVNCLMYEPNNVGQLTACLNKILFDHDLRSNLILEGLRTSRLFSWKNSCNQLLGVLRSD